MSKTEYLRPNVLGDLRAEADEEMLNRAFLETADYRTLIETSDRTVVVGRRGTGKSALTVQLARHWSLENLTAVIKISPEEYQTIGIRPQIGLFGDSFIKIRAGARLTWRYALMLEAASRLTSIAKFKNTDGFQFLRERVKTWAESGSDIVDRYNETLKKVIDTSLTYENRIGLLPKSLDITKVESALSDACRISGTMVVFLIDRLDEGYEPDDKGTALIDGLVQAAIDLKTSNSNVKPIIFLRDNIFRAVQKLDPDYSRNIEGHVLRLHWDEESLFYFATKRLKIAFNAEQEAGLKIWNRYTAGDLKGREGFRKCLQLTLYRPRDLLSLLNEAFYLAGKNGQTEIVYEHIETTGRTISQNRLDDLKKEYIAILPGLSNYIAAFHGRDPEMTVEEVQVLLERLLIAGSEDSVVQQDFIILEDARTIVRGLYSIGFLGVRDPSAGKFVFCHDGRAPDRDFSGHDRILVHPCYWMALNSTRNSLEPGEAEEIYDEYDIEVSSETPVIRNSKIRALIDKLDKIDLGASGASEFELWCHKAIRICFAKGLRNVELKPNKIAKIQRDVIGTNLCEGDAWEKICNEYGTRQVTFEVKNYQELEASDYQQVQSYLTGEYGRLAFIITRDDSENLYANKDLVWVRELYAKHNVLIIKLTGKFLANLLYKLRNPQKHDAVNNALNRLLSTYRDLYIEGKTTSQNTVNKRKARKRSKRKSWSA